MRNVVLIYGKQGTGKSTLTRSIIKTLSPKYERTVILDLQSEYDRDFTVVSEQELVNAILDNQKTIAVEIEDFDEVEKIFSVIWDTTNTLLIIDEAELFIDKITTARRSYIHKIIAFGRHHNIGIVAIARRPVELNVYLRASKTTLITFRLEEPIDIQRIVAYGINENEVTSLGEHSFIIQGDESILPKKKATKSQKPITNNIEGIFL